MVTKLKKKAKPANTTCEPLAGSVEDSAQQIWQAGLGAFNKAKVEGGKAIDALVKEGINLQRKTQSAAEEKISEATAKMSNMATDISSKASGQWDKLESIFEDRVAKALNKLGVPSATDISDLIDRINELNKSVQKLAAKTLVPHAAPKKAAKPAAKGRAKAAAKPAAKRAAKSKKTTLASAT